MPSSIRPRRSPSPRAVAPPTVPARQISSTLGQRRKSSPRSLASAAADDTVVSMLQVSVDAQPSEPRARFTPASISSRTGATPEPMRRLLHGLCCTLAPDSARSRISSASSHTACTSEVFGFRKPSSDRYLHESLAVLDEAGHDLQPRLLHVDDHRQIELVRESPRLAQEALGATLGRRRGDDEPDAPLAWVPFAREPAAKREELLGSGARIPRERSPRLLRKLFLGIRQRLEEGPVHHADADERAHADILVRLVDGGEMLGIELRCDVEVVDDRGRAAAQRLDRADQRAEIDLARRIGVAVRRADVEAPVLERGVVVAALLEVFVRVQMPVDETGGGEQQAAVDRRVRGQRPRAGRSCLLDRRAVEQQVEAAEARKALAVDRQDVPDER